MKKLRMLAMMTVVLLGCGFISPSWAGFKVKIDKQTKGEIGIWMQTWYQWVEDGLKRGADYEDMNDFMIRRAYMYLKGQVTDYVSFFCHVASDKVGMEMPDGKNLDKSGMGLGTGVAWRDLWITLTFERGI